MTRAFRSTPRNLLLAILTTLSLAAPNAVEAEQSPLPDYVIEEFGEPPAIPTGALSETVKAAVRTAFVTSVEQGQWGRDQTLALGEIVDSKDPRLVWIISDLMRFASSPELNGVLASAASTLLGKDLPNHNHWGLVTDHLIAWDIPAPPDYLPVKRAIFTGIVPGWDRLFVEGDIDWRMVSWGGVLIDDRAYDKTDALCNCIPAADNPEVSSAEDATWLKDEDIVFGIEHQQQSHTGHLHFRERSVDPEMGLDRNRHDFLEIRHHAYRRIIDIR